MVTKKELLKLVGQNIRKYRTDRNMTQDELAEKVQISTSFCANIESGNKGMSLWVLRAIADALQVTTDSLLYENTKEKEITSLSLFLSDMPEAYIAKIEKIARLFADTADQQGAGGDTDGTA